MAHACTYPEMRTGICTQGEAQTDHVDIIGRFHQGDEVPIDRTNGPGSSVDTPSAPPARHYDWESGDYVGTYGPCPPDDLDCPGADPITLADIATFRPAAPQAGMEPDGWAVVGLPANFTASAQTHAVDGTLLDRPAQVRFTPVTYRWSHSDGTTVTTSDGGATWSTLRVREFTPTPTSHVYESRGPHTVRLTIGYTAEYRFGADWVPIHGIVHQETPARDILATTIRTVLVDGDCTTAPRAPGC